ncbi:hypothetical protein [Pseudomonas sp.]|uniref:hypothetical protein n=1 Tax=Pseudomonas sp. TaxID=306 RepID=UPI0019F318E5|nr:hypothetical protein [Pseudomonas sp.]MBF0676184.1 hypothetical protein [Pseudomonas sp.]
MYYELTAYVIVFTTIPSLALLALLIYIYRSTENEKSINPLIATLLSVGVSILFLVAAELLFNIISSLREFRVKAPPIITYIAYLATFIYFTAKERFKFIVAFPCFLLGAISIIFAGVPVLFWFGCATGPVCM